jgi:hypothetical protein
MLRVCQQNQLRYRYVLADSWFSSDDNMAFIKVDMDKDLIMALKCKRAVAWGDGFHEVRVNTVEGFWSLLLRALPASVIPRRRFP